MTHTNQWLSTVLGLFFLLLSTFTHGQWNLWSTEGSSGDPYIAELNGYIYWSSINDDVLRTADNGVTWENVGPWTSNVRSLHVLGNSIFVSTFDGLFRSNDDGSTWVDVTGVIVNSLGGVSHVHRIRNIAGYLFAIMDENDEGLYRSADNGDSWVDIQFSPYDLVDVIEHNGALYSPDHFGRLFKSVNNGTSWNMISFTEVYKAMASIGDNIILLGSGGVTYSSDDGATWYGLPFPHPYQASQYDGSIIEMDGYYYSNAGWKIARSVDGLEWEEYNGGLPYGPAINFLGRAGDAIYAVNWHGAYSLQSTVGIPEFETDDISAYPNPSDGPMVITTTRTYGANSRYELFNCVGSLVASGTVRSSTFNIEHPGASGSYVLVLHNNTEQVRLHLVFE